MDRGFLSSQVASPAQRRLALGVLVVSAIVFAALAPFAKTRLDEMPAFLPAYEAALIVTELVTVALLLGQFRILRTRSLGVLAGAYLLSALMALAHALSFPGLFLERGLPGAGMQSTAWIYFLWHGAFAAAVIAYAAIRPSPAHEEAGGGIFAIVGAAAGIAVLLVWLATGGSAALPALMQGNTDAPGKFAVAALTWLVGLAAIPMLCRRRPLTVLDLWLVVVMAAWILDVALAAVLNGGRYDVGWYAGRVYGLAASSFVLVVLLLENGVLHGRLYAAHAEAQASRAVAEDATQAKSMFLANMSHEIRTPLNAIIGLTHLMLKTELSARQRDYASKVHNAGTSLLGIINDILDLSKVEAGKLSLEATEFELDGVLQNVAGLVGQKAADKGLEFLFDTDPQLPHALVGDPLRLGQVLTNLANNAIKFTEAGQVAIRVRRIETIGARVQLRFEVSDSGIGMTAEQVQRLFQPFQQADGSTTRRYGGTGLGLTIAKRLVELMGGSIEVRSAPAQGSTFVFTAWLGVRENAPRRRALPETLSGMRMLVVDDNASAREILSEQLGALGLAVSAVPSGEEAIRAVSAARLDHPFDAVFVDWRMPGLDGFETARRLRATKDLRIVMVTAFGREDVRQHAGDLGIDAFLVKPVSPSSLLDVLVSLFAPQAKSEARDAAQAVVPASLHGMRVLLAEDNDINRQIAVELLEAAGVRVETAGDGELALSRLLGPDSAGFDAVLMDVQMPRMDGLEATRRLLAQRGAEAPPIIAMTAHALEDERARCLAAGMVDHVAKPIDPHALYGALERWHKSRRSAPAPLAAAAPAGPAPGALGELPGVDVADGLRRVAGNEALYLRLLRQFAERERDAGPRLGELLRASRREEARSEAHRVKGVAGNLGLKALHAAAASLEAALAAGGEAAGELDAFASAAAVLAQLEAALAGTGQAGLRESPQSDALGRLRALLGASDADAVAYFEAHSTSLLRTLGDQAHAELGRALRAFDFDAAQRLLGGAGGERHTQEKVA